MSLEDGDHRAPLVNEKGKMSLSFCLQCLGRWMSVIWSPLRDTLSGSSLLWFLFIFASICFYFLLVFVTDNEGGNNYIIADIFLIICMAFGFLVQAGCLCKSSNPKFVQFGKLGQEHSTTYLMAGIYVFGIGTLATIVLRLLIYFHVHEQIIDCHLKNVSQTPLVDILRAKVEKGTPNNTHAKSLLLLDGFCYTDVAFDAVRLLFTLLQLYFIQTFREAVFERSILVQFALYHTIMTNCCVWIRYVVDETHLFHRDEYHSSIDQFAIKAFSMEEIMTPFVLEYSLVSAGLLYTISSQMKGIENSGTVHNGTHLLQNGMSSISQDANAANEIGPNHDDPVQIGASDQQESQVAPVQPDPNSHEEDQGAAGSQPGLICGAFLGLLLLLSSLMLNKRQTKFSKRSHDFFLAYEGALALLQIIAMVWTLKLLQHHRKSAHKLHSEDTLLLIGYLGTFAFNWLAIYSVIEVLHSHSSDNEGTDILTLTQLLILIISHFLQAILVIISRRYSLIREQEDSAKKIRQMALFMLTTNLGFWALDSFVEMKGGASSSYPSGKMVLKDAWNVVTSITYPFLVFYRFHSAQMLYELFSRFNIKE